VYFGGKFDALDDVTMISEYYKKEELPETLVWMVKENDEVGVVNAECVGDYLSKGLEEKDRENSIWAILRENIPGYDFVLR
jgi:hypothetical protein